jgi:hypothetical protein
VFWNTRGLNKIGRTNCIADLIKQHKLDFIGIQETKKVVIDNSYLNAINKDMAWNYIPAKGIILGILWVLDLMLLKFLAGRSLNFVCC